MIKFEVLLSRSAEKELKMLQRPLQERIRNTLQELEIDPFRTRPKVDIKKLHKMSKHEFYRVRVGNYRVVYAIENTKIKVTAIFNREKGYDWLE